MAICIKEAIRRIIKEVGEVSSEILPIENANNRISAQDIYVKYSLPLFNNSAMDGYGVRLADINKKVKVIDKIFAGSEKETQIEDGECIKIMTGARVPNSVEAIIPFELIEIIDENYIKLPSKIKNNQHIRFKGEDIEKGEKFLSNQDEINFATITMLASQGISHIKVYRNPKVSIFTSGEELRPHYETIKDYQIYNSNTPTLLSRVKELGAEVSFIGMAKDNIKSLQETIKDSLHSDLIITSGGISNGDADFTKKAFESFDIDIIIDGISIKPGKPTVFGKIGKTYILNLPGNPLAAALIFEMFGKIILQKLSGSKNIYHNTLYTKIKDNFDNKKGRTSLIPGFFDGEYFTPSEKRSAGMVSILNNCNSIMVLNKQNEKIAKNSIVKILPINWKFFTNKNKDFFN